MNEKEIKDLLNTIEDQIPDDYCRSYDSVDGLYHTWPDEDSWQYKTLEYIKSLQQENKQLKEQLQHKNEVIEKVEKYLNGLHNYHMECDIETKLIKLYSSEKDFVKDILDILNIKESK